MLSITINDVMAYLFKLKNQRCFCGTCKKKCVRVYLEMDLCCKENLDYAMVRQCLKRKTVDLTKKLNK